MKNDEDPNKLKQEEDKRKKEEQEKELQNQMDKEVKYYFNVVFGIKYIFCHQFSATNRCPLDLNREKRPESRLKRMQSVNGKAESWQRNKMRRRGC